MTKDKFLELLEHNKDLLSAENFARLKDDAVEMSEGVMEYVALELKGAREQMAKIDKAGEQIAEVYKRGSEMLKHDKQDVIQRVRTHMKAKETTERKGEIENANTLLNNL